MELLPEDKNNSQINNGELEHNVRYHEASLNDSLDVDKAQITLLESNGKKKQRKFINFFKLYVNVYVFVGNFYVQIMSKPDEHTDTVVDEHGNQISQVSINGYIYIHIYNNTTIRLKTKHERACLK